MSAPVGGRPFASPWPYTYLLAGTGLMGGTATRQSTGYTSTKPQDQSQVQVPGFGYGADNPAFGAITRYGAFPLGMGLRAQRRTDAAEDLQYDYALGVDASVYPWVKGPDVTLFTPATTDAVQGVVRFMKVGTNYYAITGRYALLRVSDASWTVAQDFGAGKVTQDALAFYANGAGAAYGFVGMGDADNLWYVTGGVWTQHASLKALAFGLTGREFYRGWSTNTLAKVDTDADPVVAANWGNANAFTIGDKSSAITRLHTTASGNLLVTKTDGVYGLDEVGDDHLLQRWLTNVANGKPAASWRNDLYLGAISSGVWRYDAEGATRAQVGPELLTDGSSVVSGIVTAMAGTAYALYGAFLNLDTGSAYLCAYLGMTERDGAPHPVWHGSLTQALPAQVRSMDVQTDGAPTNHARLYLGFTSGAIGWFTLPCTPHPADCTAYGFTTTDGTLRLPTWDGGFGANVKALDAATATGRNLSSATYLTAATRSDPAGTFVALAEAFDSGQREKVGFPTGANATMLDVQLTLVSTATSASPQVTGFGLHHQVQTPYRQVFSVLVLAEDGLRRRDGSPMRIGRARVRAVVEAAADTPGSVTLVLPEGDSVQVRVKGVTKTVAWDRATRRTRAAYQLECVQVQTNAATGTYDRIEAVGTYDVIEAYTYDQLEAL